MRTFRQLRLSEREILFAGLESGRSLRELGRKLGRPHSSLSRELKRNAKYGYPYIPCRAHLKYLERAKSQRAKAPLKSQAVLLYVRENLRERWSPEVIAGRWNLEHPEDTIHFETIYRYIYRGEQRKERLWEYLPRHKRKRTKKEGRSIKRQGRIPEARSIDLRPKSVAARREMGHWETDNVGGKQSDSRTISITEERVSRYTILDKLPDKKAHSKKEAVIDRLLELPLPLRKTLTLDNGSENVCHKEMELSLGLKTYFCHAYHCWEKGSVENNIKLVRRFIPKGESLDLVPEEEVRRIEAWINSMPRKCLGFRTPHEILRQKAPAAISKYYSKATF